MALEEPRRGLAHTHYGGWGVDTGFFRSRLEAGNCLLLFDGFDEAPGRVEREALASDIRLRASFRSHPRAGHCPSRTR